jgi:hypothetical protein
LLLLLRDALLRRPPAVRLRAGLRRLLPLLPRPAVLRCRVLLVRSRLLLPLLLVLLGMVPPQLIFAVLRHFFKSPYGLRQLRRQVSNVIRGVCVISNTHRRTPSHYIPRCDGVRLCSCGPHGDSRPAPFA